MVPDEGWCWGKYVKEELKLVEKLLSEKERGSGGYNAEYTDYQNLHRRLKLKPNQVPEKWGCMEDGVLMLALLAGKVRDVAA